MTTHLCTREEGSGVWVSLDRAIVLLCRKVAFSRYWRRPSSSRSGLARKFPQSARLDEGLGIGYLWARCYQIAQAAGQVHDRFLVHEAAHGGIYSILPRSFGGDLDLRGQLPEGECHVVGGFLLQLEFDAGALVASFTRNNCAPGTTAPELCWMAPLQGRTDCDAGLLPRRVPRQVTKAKRGQIPLQGTLGWTRRMTNSRRTSLPIATRE